MNTSIKMVDLHGQYLNIKDEVDQAIQDVIDSSAFINGEPVKKFAEELSAYTGSEYVIPCANGTDALQIAYMALGLKPDDEIIMPSFNYVASAEAASLLGLKPVFVDAHEDTFFIDEKLIEEKITQKTKAIVAVHLFGQMGNMEAIMAIANKYNLKVIEDNAQAIGAEYTFSNGSSILSGNIGHISTISFFPSKNLGCFGDGGAILTNDKELAKKADMISKHGQKEKYNYEYIGCNSRLDTLQAAILRVKLKYIKQYNEKRQAAALIYDELLGNSDRVFIPVRNNFSSHVYHQYVIKIPNQRNKVKELLKDNGIPSMVYYPSPLHLQKAFEYLSNKKESLPVTERLCKEVLALPIHTELAEETQRYIIEQLLKVIDS
jgi:dTDP-4-amino-4,6-dideoxygalactose transaminase